MTLRLQTIGEWWDRCFFAPSSPLPVAAFRILFGVMLMQYIWMQLWDLDIWFGNLGYMSAQSMKDTATTATLNLFNYVPVNEQTVIALFAILFLAAALLTIGFQTRLAALVSYLITVSLFHRDPYLMNSGDTLMRAVSFWLIFAPAGSAWSVDAWLKKRRAEAPYCELAASWGLRLLQFQMVIVYLDAFLTKTLGFVWSMGSAVYVSMRLEDLKRLPLPVDFDSLAVSRFFTWLTVAIEGFLCTLVWIKELRYYILGLGICMHLTIDWVMNIPQFEWLMISMYVLFVYPEDLERLSALAGRALGSRAQRTPAETNAAS